MIRCKESKWAISRRLKEWHPWYAWHPVKASTGNPAIECWVWLEHIERKVGYHHSYYYYRIPR